MSGGHNDKEVFFVKDGQMLFRLFASEISWVEVEGNYLKIVTPSKTFTLRASLRKLEEKLPEGVFIKIHRSVLVRFSAIDKVDFRSNQVYIKDQSLPLGPSYKEGLLNVLELLN